MEVWDDQELPAIKLLYVFYSICKSLVLRANQRCAALHCIMLVLVLDDAIILFENFLLGNIYSIIYQVVSYFEYLIIEINMASNKLVIAGFNPTDKLLILSFHGENNAF